MSTTSTPNSSGHLLLRRQRLEALRERVLRERPGGHAGRQAPPGTAAPAGCAAQRHEREPDERPDQRGRRGAARLRQEDREHARAHRGIGEHARGRAAGPARAEPERDRHRHGCDAPERVPVVERLAEPVRDLVLRERTRPDPRGEREGHRHDRADQERQQEGRRRPRRDPSRRHRRAEEREVGEGPPGLDVGEVGAIDHSTDTAVRRASIGEQQERRHAVARPPASPQDGRRDDAAAHEHHRDLRDGRPRELGAALGPECDAREGTADDQWKCVSCGG